ncbi:autotransporter-associated beta strand repeat-containing protein [Luteolibacter ambystomatis]|uniref:Autotransporter-associated beta strand repeat-containing protein n=1 Tax=Luteolibacter ambystomatis TaxID=2824561 RepID=A0A975J239_9BACT|nr:autotransporter-associated beta strand repeat-containing protein [Luteolibacter ambystomatis]QUE52623.1 autotransporter-associated beta strand repeat-containing protein [Luteolibacter ambystomatis]
MPRKPLVAAALLLGNQTFHAQASIPAFPGAEGFGALAVGGRGGDVYHVTNLNSSGAGSLAYGIANAPAAGRTIVFDVSGYIHVPGSNLRMTQNKVTIAGQTAPGDGIGLKDGTFRISADDVVIRHLRFRHGKYGSGGDCIDLDSNSTRSVLDHISMQFSTDENMSSFSSPPEDLTLQWAVNAWGLESHSCGGLWDQNHATAHHTLWAHNHTRNPKARPGTLDWINNVTFDWDIGFIMGDSETPASWKANVRNNYFLSPPGNLRSKALEKASLDRNGVPNFSLYLNGCLHDADGDGILNGTDKGYGIASGSYNTSATPFPSSAVAVTMDNALTAYKKVVSQGGALRLSVDASQTLRDEVDTILFAALTGQVHKHVTRESETGASNAGFGTLASASSPIDSDQDGMPDYWEQALGFNPAVDDHNTAFTGSGGVITGTTFFPASTPLGYTRLEEYLHFLAIPHGVVAKSTGSAPTSISIDLRKFTLGFPNTPVFTLSGVTGGAAVQSGTGGAIVTFNPTVNTSGRARFEFTVTDADGSTWTQTCGILVSSSALPRDLKWKGDGTSNLWDTSSLNFQQGSTVTAFGNGDRLVFDDTGSTSPSVSIPSTVSPGSMDVIASANYTFTGAGSIGSTGPLLKRGTGTLSLSNSATNGFSAVTVEEGTLALNSAGAAGTAPIRMNGGALTLNAASNGTISNALQFDTDTTITVQSQHNETGNWTGAGNVTVNGNYLWTVGGTWTGYTGRLTLGAGGPRIRLNGGFGSPAVAVDLGTNGQLMNRNGSATSYDIGSLSGASGSTLSGAQSVVAASTYSIGAKGESTIFSGAIVNGTGNAATNIIKTGAGSLTLAGTSTHTGTTTVNAGTLSITGALGSTAITVANGGTLAGTGSVTGPVTLQSGGILSPGTAATPAGVLQVAGGVTLPNGSVLPFDLSSSSSGGNDRVAMQGGTLTASGTLNFKFRLTDGLLGPGTYPLIDGATGSAISGLSLTHNLPTTGTRQTFALGRSASGSNPSSIWLTVTGNAASLVWKGNTNGNWDLNTTSNWTNGGVASTYYNFDALTFDDTATTAMLTLASPVAPRSMIVDNSSKAYTLAGHAISGTGKLTKRGTNTLTLSPVGVTLDSGTTASSATVTVVTTNLAAGMSVTGPGIPAGTVIAAIVDGGTLTLSQNATATASPVALRYVAMNSWTGGTDIEGGTIQFTNDDGNAYGLGPGPITFKGGTLSMYRNSATYNSATYNFVVPAGQTGTFNADDRCDLYGTLTGGGTLDFRIPYVRTTLYGDWSGFTGKLRVIDSTNNGGDLRFGPSYGYPGFPNAAVELTANTTAYYVGTLSGGDGTTVSIGEVSGDASAYLMGGATGGRFLTYRIGGIGTNATFAGVIADQNVYCPTSVVKTGSGTWTLSGNSTYGGRTTVEQGVLKVTGSLTSLNTLEVANGAALQLEGGTLALDTVTAGAGAIMSAYGTVTGDLVGGGALSLRGYGTGTGGPLVVGGSLTLPDGGLLQARIGASADSVSVAGDLSMGGILNLSVPAGTAAGRYPLFTVSGSVQVGAVSLTGAPSGLTAVLDTTVAGQVAVVLAGPYEQWRFSKFGSYSSLESDPNADPDSDGQSNQVEFLAGTLPKNPASRFSASVAKEGAGFKVSWNSVAGKSYQVEAATMLSSGWAVIATKTATATTTDYTDASGLPKRFYRVKVVP